MGVIGHTKEGFTIYKSSEKELKELNKALDFNQFFENGKKGKLQTFKTPKDLCEYQQIETAFSSCGKYEVIIICLGEKLTFKTTLEKEQETIYKKVRLHYLKKDKASKLTKEICFKYYNK